MKLCTECLHFMQIGAANLICQSPKTQVAKLVGVRASKCEKERSRHPDKGCSWSAQFFEPKRD